MIYRRYIFCVLLIFLISIVQISGAEEECIPEIKCGEWSGCDIRGKIDKILSEKLDIEEDTTHHCMIVIIKKGHVLI